MVRIKLFIDNNKRLLKDYITVIFGTGVGRGISFATSLILARFLGKGGFGFFSVFFTIMMLVWQIPTIIDIVYIRFAKVETKEKKTEYLRAAFFIKLTVFVLFLLCAYPLGRILAGNVFQKAELAFYITTAIFTGAMLSVFASVAGVHLEKERFNVFSVVNLTYYVLVFILIGIIILAGMPLTPLKAIIVNLVCAVGVGCFGFIYMYKKIHSLFPVHKTHFLNMFHFGKWLLADTLSFFILQRMDILFLARYAHYEELGIYSAAVRLAMLASLLSATSSAIFIPRGCESCKSAQHLKTYLRESLTVISGISLCILTLVFLSPVLIKLFFGREYMQSVLPARILFFEALFVIIYTPFSYLFYATNNTKKIFILGITKLIAAVIFLLWLVPRYGSLGAALSIALSSFCGMMGIVWWAIRLIKNTNEGFIPDEEYKGAKKTITPETLT